MKLRFPLLAALLFSAFAISAQDWLFKDGRTDWKIVITAKPSNVEVSAADDLACYLKKISGCDFAIEKTDNAPKAKAIIVGAADHAPAVAQQAAALKLDAGTEQKVANAVLDGNLYLASRTDYGVFEAVWMFLHDQMGVRIYWPEHEPDGEFVTRRASYQLPALAVSYDPPLKYRGYHFCGAHNLVTEKWLARNMGNIVLGGLARGNEGIAERNAIGYYSFSSGHLIDPEHRDLKLDIPKAMKEHPEWFALFNGRRVKDQFCWSNPEVDALLIAWLKDRARRYPGLKIMGMYAADNYHYCQCPKCARKTVSQNWFSILRRLTDALRPDFPNLRFASLAYQGYTEPPEGLDMHGYEFIQYALLQRCFGELMANCGANKKEATFIKKWQDAGASIGIYGYEYDSITPCPFLPRYEWLDDQMKYFKSAKIAAVLPEITNSGHGSYQAKDISRFTMRLFFYVQTRLLWNPDLDYKAVIRDFCDHIFPDAAQEIYDMHLLLDNRICHPGRHMSGCLYNASFIIPFLKEKDIDAVFTLLNKAQAKITAANSADAARQLRELATERTLFSFWAAQHWLASANILELSEDFPTELTLAPRMKLKAKIADGNIACTLTAATAPAKIAVQAPDGVIATPDMTAANGAVAFGIPLPQETAGIAYRRIAFTIPGKDKPVTAVLLLKRREKDKRNVLVVVPQNGYCTPKVRSELYTQSWRAFVKTNVQDCMPLAPDKIKAVVVRCKDVANVMDYVRDTVIPYVKAGGNAFLSMSSDWNSAKLIPDATYALGWTGPQEPNRGVKPIVTPDGQWLLIENHLRWYLETKSCTPTEAFLIPQNSPWQAFVNTNLKPGQKNGACLLHAPYGKGHLFLTSGKFTFGDPQDWDYLFGHTYAISRFLNSVFSHY